MIRRALRKGVLLGLLGGLAAAVAKLARWWREDERIPPPVDWPPLAEPDAPGPDAVPDAVPAGAGEATAPVDDVPWVDTEDGSCPATHPLKAKLASGIFHVPGMASYERTNADRCYRDQAAAEADGLRQAQR
ncbi:MAG: hypothetical protein ACRDZ9_08215 [Acidimicrobiales bacterium]